MAKISPAMSEVFGSQFQSSYGNLQRRNTELLATFKEEARESLNSSMSLREKLEYFLATSRIGMLLDLFNALLSVLSCFLYVLETYEASRIRYDPNVFLDMDLGTSCFFLVLFFLHFFSAQKKLSFLFSLSTFVEMLTIVPGFLDQYLFKIGEYDLNSASPVMKIMVFMRLLRIFRLERISRLLTFVESEILRQVYSMALSVLSIVYFASGLMHLVENSREFWPSNAGAFVERDFFEAIYLVVTTITTVGYGDIAPVTTPGRVVIMLMMGTTLILVPRQTNRLIALMGMTSVYARQSFKHTAQSSHIVVAGEVEGRSILDFFKEFFHPDHGNRSQHAVIIGEGLPSAEVRSLLTDPRFAYVITYLDGNIMQDRDLKRAAIEHADAIFLLTNKFSTAPQKDDANCILRALSIQRYFQKKAEERDSFKKELEEKKRPSRSFLNALAFSGSSGALKKRKRNRRRKATLCLQLLQSESHKLFQNSTKQINGREFFQHQVVCINEMKNNILAKNCLVPGLITLVNNLISSSDDAILSKQDLRWMHEYSEGVGFEIYRVELAKTFCALPFAQVSRAVYMSTGVLIFALELVHVTAGSCVALNPGSFKIPQIKDDLAIFALVIAGDVDEALVVSKDDKLPDSLFEALHEMAYARKRKKRSSMTPNGAVSAITKHGSKLIDSLESSTFFPNKTKKRFGKETGPSILEDDFDGLEKLEDNQKMHVFNGTRTQSKGENKSKFSQLWKHARQSIAVTEDTRKAILRRHYFATEEPQSLAECLISSIDDCFSDDFYGHIVVIGNPVHMYNFVLPLRSRKLERLVSIVIMQPELPTASEWQVLANFQDVFFMQGSPLDVHDLTRARVQAASKAVIFAKPHDVSGNSSEALTDADTIFAYSMLRRQNPKMHIIIELMAQSNISYIADVDDHHSKLAAADRHLYVPPFAAGHVYTSAVLDTIAGQSFYNSKLIDILQQLVVGQDIEKAQIWKKKAKETITEDIPCSELFTISVPDEFDGKTYGDLVEELTFQDVISLGIRREVSPAAGNKLPYVITNPSKDLAIHANDSVFALSTDNLSLEAQASDPFANPKHMAAALNPFESASAMRSEEKSDKKRNPTKMHDPSLESNPSSSLSELRQEVRTELAKLGKELQELLKS